MGAGECMIAGDNYTGMEWCGADNIDKRAISLRGG